MSTAVRKVCGIAASSALATFTYGAAYAADLGGNCCADLEERVAELEATTARKGNRKVSLTVSGHVHEALLFYDVSGAGQAAVNFDGSATKKANANLDESNVYIGTHNSSRSRFRFRGSATINADWSAGFYMEFGVRRNALNGTSQVNPRVDSGIDIRHEALYVKSKTLGTIWLGWTGSAVEGITEICLGCTLGNASPDFSFTVNGLLARGGTTFTKHGSASGFFAGEGDRRNMIKWISPTLAGFSVSASWGGDDFWDAALRYAGEFGGLRLAAGIGYSQDTNGVDAAGISAIGCEGANAVRGPAQPVVQGNNVVPNAEDKRAIADADRDCTTLGMSASVMHTPSGIYVRGSYGQNNNENAANNNDQDSGWEVTAGISQKWNSLGKTNLWGLYGESTREIGLKAGTENQLTTYGIGIDQKIDAAAMEVYLWWRHFEAEADGVDAGEADVVVLGTRIKF